MNAGTLLVLLVGVLTGVVLVALLSDSFSL